MEEERKSLISVVCAQRAIVLALPVQNKVFFCFFFIFDRFDCQVTAAAGNSLTNMTLVFFFPRAPPSSFFSPKPIKTPLPAMLSRTEKSCLCRVYSFFGVDFLFIIIKTSCFSCASKAHSVSLYWQTLPGAKGILCCRCSNSAIIIIISH